jgi:hypothetical protein
LKPWLCCGWRQSHPLVPSFWQQLQQTIKNFTIRKEQKSQLYWDTVFITLKSERIIRPCFWLELKHTIIRHLAKLGPSVIMHGAKRLSGAAQAVAR